MGTGNAEIMNANYDPDDQWTLTDSSLHKTSALQGSFGWFEVKRSVTT